MKKVANGTMKQVAFQIIALSLIPNEGKKNPKNAGKYALRCLPIAGDDVNPAGNFFLTEKQLSQLAAEYGLSDWTVLSTIVAEGDSTFHVTAKFCAEGEADAEDPSIVYTTDWWKVENTTLEIGDAGKDFLREVTLQLAVTANKEARNENKRIANANRLKALLAVNTKKAGAVAHDEPEDVEVEEEEDLELEEAIVEPPKGGKGGRRS